MANSPTTVSKTRRWLPRIVVLSLLAVGLFYFAFKPKNPVWLGNRDHNAPLATLYSVMENDSSDFAISLKVIEGRDIQIPFTRNAIVTCQKGTVVQVMKPGISTASRYLVGEIRLKERYGRRIYVCDLEITNGPLKGSVVHLRDGYCPESIPDPYFSYFEIPRTLNPAPGPVEFKIVGWFTI